MPLPSQKASRYGVFLVILGALFYCYEYFLRIAPAVIHDDLMSYFHIDATLFGTLSGFYYYAYTPIQLVVGVSLDRYRPRHVITVAILACAIGSLMFISTPNYTVAAIGRFLQGFGSAFAFVGALKLASRFLSAWWFASFAGICTTLGFLGGASGDILLTHAVAHMGWKHLIMIFVVLGFVLAFIFWAAMAFRPKDMKIFDKQKDGEVLTLVKAFAQLLKMFKQPYLWTAGVLGALLFLPTIVFADLWGIPYLQVFHGYTLQQAGLATSMIYFGWAFGSPFHGVISNLLNKRLRVICWGAFLALIIGSVVLYDHSLSFTETCVLFLLFGIVSSVECLTFAMGADVCTPQTTAMTMAFINFFVMLSGMFMQTGVGWLLDLNWSGKVVNGLRAYTSSDYQHAMLVVPMSLALATLIAFCVRDKKLRLK